MTKPQGDGSNGPFQTPWIGSPWLTDQAFGASPLDRASAERKSSVWLMQKLQAEGTRILPFWRGRPLLTRDEQKHSIIAWLSLAQLNELLPHPGPLIFLGLEESGTALFGCGTDNSRPLDEDEAWRAKGRFVDLRNAASALRTAETSIAAQARSLLEWHAKNSHCANCGAPTEIRDGGYRRSCGACETDHFPRTDPVAIMAVLSADRILLGRSKDWPAQFFSALAGFVEPGEGLEATVAREVLEESGVRIDEVRYATSQNWPFPSSLMLGCYARAVTEEINHDPEELEEARWFTRTEVLQALASTGAPNGLIGAEEGPLWLPPPAAIAHRLIRAWAEWKA